MSTESKNNTRNVSIEILRILSFCMVIFNHILNRHYTIADGSMYNTVCFFNMFNIVAVPCFFMITGYFTFNHYSFLESLKKCVFNILLPTIIAIILTMQLYPVLSSTGGNIRFAECFQFDWNRYMDLWMHVRAWNISVVGVSHLWYIQSYVKVIILMPVLALICSNSPKATMARRYLIIIILLGLGIQNWMTSIPNEWMLLPYIPFDTCVLAILSGYEIKNDEKYLKKRWTTSLGFFFGYIVFSIIGYVLEKSLVSGSEGFNDYYFHYASVPCQLASVCIFITFIVMPLRVNDTVSKIICKIGKATFPAYLLQGLCLVPVSNLVNSWKLFHGMSNYIISTMLCILILITISLLWITIEKAFKNFIHKGDKNYAVSNL